MLMTLQLVIFLVTLEHVRMSDAFIHYSHHDPQPLCPGHGCCGASAPRLSSAGRSPGVRLERGTQGARAALGPL